MYRTPKRYAANNENNSVLNVTPPNQILRAKISDSEDKRSVNGSPNSRVLSPSEIRRGRPRAEVLNALILQGATSPSSIKCTFCNRVFPREKSLQAHLRTHTGNNNK